MTGLLSLGLDILGNEIIPMLSINDVMAIDLTCRELNSITRDPIVWHNLYRNTYNYDIIKPIDKNWQQEYRHRGKYMAYAWGQNADARLGFLPSQAPAEKRSESGQGISLPMAIPRLEELKLKDISCGGYSITVLTTDGDLYTMGSLGVMGLNWAVPRRTTGRLRAEEYKPAQLTMESPYKYIQVCSGRERILALSENGTVVQWDRSKHSPGTVLRFALERKHGHFVTRISCGWNLCAGLVQHGGLIIWWNDAASRGSNLKQEYINVPHATVPYTTFDDGSELQPVKIAAGQDAVVFINGNGELYLVQAATAQSVTTSRPAKIEAPGLISDESIFTNVFAALNRFAAVTDSGELVIWKKDDTTKAFVPQIYPELKNEAVCSVAFGDHHNLVLCESGSVYAWGHESQGCGSFGLGKREHLVGLNAVENGPFFRVSDISLASPRKLDIKGVTRISAGGWQSAAIAAPETESNTFE